MRFAFSFRGVGLLFGRVLTSMAAVCLLAGCVVTPWALGGNLAEAELALSAATAAALLLAVAAWAAGGWALRLPLAGCVLAAAIVWSLIQCAPLPQWLVRWVSPSAVQLREQLASDGPPGAWSVTASGDRAHDALDVDSRPKRASGGPERLSLYPSVTRRTGYVLCVAFGGLLLGGWLAGSRRGVLALLVLVAINGALLSGFGMGQQLVWNGKIYGVVELPTERGQPFGPYVNRNNAGGYLNLCLAAAVGLVVWAWGPAYLAPAVKLPERLRGDWPERLRRTVAGLSASKLASAVAVVAIAAGILSSLSRGAALAMCVAGLVVCVPLVVRRRTLFVALVGVLVAAAGLLHWLGRLDPIHERLATAAEPDRAIAGRLEHWQVAMRLVPRFWVAGTGLGTYRFVYRLEQHEPSDVWFYHAENQFVESLVEAGVVGLGLLLAMLVAVAWAAVRLIGSPRKLDRAVGVMGVFALASQIVAGAFDFGLYLPANMFLMAALCGLVVGQYQEAGAGWLAVRQSARPVWRGGLAVAIAIGAVAGAALAARDARARQLDRRVDQIARRYAGRLWEMPPADVSGAERLLHDALRIRPDDAQLRYRLAELYIHRYRSEAADRVLAENTTLQDRQEAWPVTSLVMLHRLARRLERDGQQEPLDWIRRSEAVRTHLSEAWRQLEMAREACPLLALVHLRMAQLDVIVRDGRHEAEHLERATRVYPTDPELLYTAGLVALDSGDVGAACRYWKRSLALGSRFQRLIIDVAKERLTVGQWQASLLPDDVDRLLEIAKQLRGQADRPLREAVLRRALQLAEVGAKKTADDFRRLAVISGELGELERAEKCWQAALALAPQQVEWRAAYAEVLYRRGRLDEAIKQYLKCHLQSRDERYRQRAEALRRERASRASSEAQLDDGT